jgi:hypothetical protein
MEYVPLINKLELFYDDPVQFEEVVQKVKDRIHRGKYNQTELLNVWRKLTHGLKDSMNCETNIRCLLSNKIEFLNYSHDHEPMIHLLTYGSPELVESVVSRFPVEKLTGFQQEHESKLSLAQDLNMDCPVMNCLELLRKSKGKESVDYKHKMDILLKYIPLQFNFTLKYISNHTLCFTTPLAYMILQNEPTMAEFIKNHGGSLDDRIKEPLCVDCQKSYYQFFQVEEVDLPLLKYFEENSKSDYALLIKQTRTFMNRKKNTMKTRANETKRNETQRMKFNQPSINLNLNAPNVNNPEINLNALNVKTPNVKTPNLNNLKERIRLNKEKRNLLFEPSTLKVRQPKNKTLKTKENPYVVVGGVGGSGTRLISSILATLGLNIGSDLNEAYDNLSFTLLYKHLNTLNMDDKTFDESYRILKNSILGTQNSLTEQEKQTLEELSEKGRPGHPHAWLKERANNIRVIDKNGPLDNPYLKELPQIQHKALLGKWGWKEPNSHMILNRLNKKTKFIMVVRNGLDMAFSSNQNQLRLWGPTILPKEMLKFDKQGHILYSPRVSMKYWTLVHKKIIEESKAFGDHFLMINFDDMCIHPEKWLQILCEFLKIDRSVIPEIRPLVIYQSEGIGRFKKHDLAQFDPSDILFAKNLGFDTEPSTPMPIQLNINIRHPRVVIGAVGGSGTRLIASMMYALGVNMGTNLNSSFDNNVFVYLFRRVQTLQLSDAKFKQYLDIMYKTFGMEKGIHLTKAESKTIDALSNIGGQQFTQKWLKRHAGILKRMITHGPDAGLNPESKEMFNEIKKEIQLKRQPLAGTWGWKAPNSHVMMYRLHQSCPDMKYIMVIRNGLDMAFSDNKNQLELWGPVLFRKEELSQPGWSSSPRLSLKYWRIVHERVLMEGSKMGPQFFLLNYDILCDKPDKTIKELLQYLGCNPDKELVNTLSGLIRKSEGIGRFRKEDLSQFDQDDIDYVESLGFDVK